MGGVIIGVDPHKLSATIEVVDQHEKLLGSGRLTTDQGRLRRDAEVREGLAGSGLGSRGRQRSWSSARPATPRSRRACGRRPAKLAARVRIFDTGHNRKADALVAHSISIVAVRTSNLRVLKVDGGIEALRMLADRREALTRRRVQTVDRLQALLAELLPGHAKKDITPLQAKAMLASVRPRDVAGKTRRRIAAENSRS